jgi:hypothetical protein
MELRTDVAWFFCFGEYFGRVQSPAKFRIDANYFA